MRATLARAVVIAAGGALALTACSSSHHHDPAPTPSNTTSTSPPTSSTPPATPGQVAGDQAAALVRNYYDVLDKIMMSPHERLQDLDLVTMDAEFLAQGKADMQLLEKGAVQTGRVKIVMITPGLVNLANNPQAKPRILPTVHVATCIDVSAVKVVDQTGKSLVVPGRPNFYSEQLVVQNYDYPNPNDWRVSSATGKAVASCVGT